MGKSINLLTLESIKSFLIQFAEHSESVYWLGDPYFSYLAYVSPAYERIWGRSRQFLYDDPRIWINYLHPDDQKRHPILEMRGKVMQDGLQAKFIETYRIVRPDGDIRWIIDRGFPVCDQTKKIIAITGVAIDITQEKKNEEVLVIARKQAEIASQAKSRFISNMSHDIKTPLSGIIGLSNLLVSLLHEGRELDFAQSILAASRELMVFLEHCIDIIRTENSEVIFVKENFNLKNLLDELTRLFEPMVIDKQLSFTMHYHQNVPPIFLGSRSGIYRVLLNLISNAIKFTPAGSVRIDINYSEKSSSTKRTILKIAVEDTGIGIPQEEQRMIFEPYSRLSPSYQNTYAGSGIGLYVASQFIKAMQGEIYLTSEEGKGSHFLVILPLEVPLLQPDEYEEIKQCSSELIAASSALLMAKKHPAVQKTEEVAIKNRRVLVVEDNNLAQMIVKTILVEIGCQVDIADTGKGALELFVVGKYDLAFMDIGLPDMSGYLVTEEIRKQEQGTAHHLPIIVLTAHATKSEEKVSPDLGIEEMLSKPLSKEQANEIVGRYFVRSATETA